jgi:hypothetical protein
MKTWPIILQMLLLSLNIRAGLFYEFNGFSGADIWFHTRAASLISNSGFVTLESMGYSSYVDYPIFQLSLAITHIVSILNMKDSLFFVLVLFSIISMVFVYLLGKSIIGPKFGLFAMLLISISDIPISRGVTSITPGSLVFCWFLIILYLIFKDSNHELIDNAIKIFLVLLLILTHQLSTLASFIALIAIFLGNQFYNHFLCCKKEYCKDSHNRIGINLTTILLFAVALQSYWMYTNARGTRSSFFVFAVSPVINVLKHGDFITDVSSNPYILYYSYHDVLSNVLFHFGYLILLFFAVIGALIWLSSKNIDDKKFSLIMGVLLLYLFVYGIPLTGIGNTGLYSRWLNFIYVFLVLLAAQGMFGLTELVKRNRNKIIAISSITLLLTFIMITTPYINGDSPIYCKDRWPRTMYTDSEIHAIQTVNNLYNGNIVTDKSYLGGIFRGVNTNFSSCSVINPDDEKSLNGMILLRECIKDEPVAIASIGGELAKLRIIGEEFFERFKTPKYDLVFCNGGVRAYLSKQEE